MKKALCLALCALFLGPIGLSRADEGQISRLPPLPENPSDPVIAKYVEEIRAARGGVILNVHRTLSYAPEVARPYFDTAIALRTKMVSPQSLRELVIYRVAQMVGSEYVRQEHERFLRGCKFNDEQIAAIPEWTQRLSLFDEKQRLVLEYAERMARDKDVDDQTFERMRAQFSSREILEYTLTASYYVDLSLVLKVLRVKLQPQSEQLALPKC